MTDTRSPKDSDSADRAAIALDDARILIVDDLRSSRMLIGSVLRAAGFHTLEFAEDGIEALEKFQAFNPDIMLLDIVMPRMDGFEVCERIRKDLKSDTPILVQSGLQEGEHRVRAFEVGASDLVSKPINAGEMISRVKLHVERRRLVESLRSYRRRMEDELKSAEAMQLSLMPEAPEIDRISEGRGARVEAFYRASNQLGGDLWTIFEIDEDRFGLLMVDLSGHGVSAAINAFRLHVLIEAHRLNRADPGTWLADLSKDLYEMLPIEHFATGFYCVFDRRTSCLTYATAGAPSPVIVKADGQTELLDASGLIMGVTSAVDYPNQQVQLKPGDRLCLYSDALYEDFNIPEKSLQPEEIADHVKASCESAEPGGFPKALMYRVYGGIPQDLPDDLTILLLEVAS
ncbi:MAG: fused response regulator/phosphatase [Alphaproteobacteria bacterium]|nr:fused response regulator/phosphatase [Alphaproteobacteria bacterium]